MGLKYNVNNRMSADCQSYFVVNSSIVPQATAVLWKACEAIGLEVRLGLVRLK